MKHCSYCHLEYDPGQLLYPRTCPRCGAEDGQDDVVTAEEWAEAQAFQARMIAARRESERNG